MKLKTIAIVGLGLMGASLAAACRKKFPHAKIIGISRSREALRFALRKKWIHSAYKDVSELPAGAADLFVLATPVDTFLPLLKKIDRLSGASILVTDVGSTKGEIQRSVVRAKWKRVVFIGAHPMCGSHERGVQAARADLYDHGMVFVMRDKNQNRSGFQTVKQFWKSIAPSVIEIQPDLHDQIVAEISHLPHAVAAALVRAVPEKSLRFCASGFRDVTRIAQSHPSLWAPIFLSNAKAVLRAIKNFEQELKLFRSALERRNERILLSFLASASKKRSQISL